MKSFLKTLIVLLCLTSLISIACNKPEVAPASNSLTPSTPTAGVIIGNKELFWEQPWDTAAEGYILNLKTLLSGDGITAIPAAKLTGNGLN